ncbi:MAG: type II toxin-antitoxin system HicA family toxin [Pseudonocardiaceae bacterium]
MSPALSDLPVGKVTRVIESLGFAYVRTKGSHAVHRHPDGRVAVVPPTRHREARHARFNPAASRHQAR